MYEYSVKFSESLSQCSRFVLYTKENISFKIKKVFTKHILDISVMVGENLIKKSSLELW